MVVWLVGRRRMWRVTKRRMQQHDGFGGGDEGEHGSHAVKKYRPFASSSGA